MASIAFAAIARVVLAAGSDPENPSRCYLMPVKQNNCQPAPTLAYRLAPDPDDEDGAALLEWEGSPVEGVRADDILGAAVSNGERDQREDAADFLQKLLADGRMRSDEVFKAGEANGYSKSTLVRAKKSAGARSYKDGFRAGWVWELTTKESPKISTSRDLTFFDQNSPLTPTESITSSKNVTIPDLTSFVDEDPEAGLV